MRRIFKTLPALATLALLLGLSGGARAEGVYAFAQQRLSDFGLTGATITGAINVTSGTSAAQEAGPSGGEAQVGLRNALQSYVGPGPRPSENNFNPVGQSNPDYVRGDVRVTGTTLGALTTNTVAESYLVSLPGLSSGGGAWSIAGRITVATPGEVVLNFNYENLLEVVYDAPVASEAVARYSFNFTVTDPDPAGPGLVFASAPTAVNRNLGLSNLGLTQPGARRLEDNGPITITWNAAQAGTFNFALTGDSQVFLTVVPEPSSVALVGLGMVGLLGYGIRRRRAAHG